MQLSVSVSPSESQLSAPVLPGMPTTAPEEGAASFDDLLPAVTPEKKPVDPSAAAMGEAAATMMMSWLAAMTPTPPPPTEVASWDGACAEPVTTEGTAVGSGEAGVSTLTDSRGVTGQSATFTLGQNPGQTPAFDAVASATHRAIRGQKLAAQCAVPTTPSDVATTPAETDELPFTAAVAEEAATPSTSSTLSTPATASAAGVPIENLPETEAASVLMADSTARLSPHAGVRAAKAAIRAEMGALNRGEKFAAVDEQIVPGKIPSLEDVEKKILNAESKELTKHDENLGIGIAMARPPMFTTLFNHPQSASVGATSAVVDQSANPASTPTAEMASQAHRAMNVILTVADRLNASTRSSVQLQFSVGGADLSIRVEMRAGEVHAVFRTDSSELRSALAAEWQAVGADQNRTTRVADAVFAPASPAGATPYLGDGASSQHRESSHRHTAEVIQFPAIQPISRTPAESTVPDFRPAAFRPELNLYTFA